VAFKIGNQTVIHDADATAAIETNSNLDILQINGIDVLTHTGGTITLKNVDIADLTETSINTDNVSEGTTNRFYTAARQTTIEAYADQSELDAIATAATDASTKSSQALINAKAYTDTNVGTEVTDRTTADTTLQNNINGKLSLTGGTLTGALILSGAPSSANHASTKAYVDSTVSSGTGALDTDNIAEGSNLYYTDARVSSYLSTNNFATQGYADTAEADAITSANAYTDTRETAITTAYQTYADTAESDAKAYTDTEVAAIVSGSPGTLNTLNELAAALGNDANLSTTLSTQIGTKVAKAGDTMTGALTLSGAPSSANHAATKAYVDSAITGGSLSNTDSLTEGSSNLYFTNSRVDARIPTSVSSFTNDSGYLTSVGTISYNSLTNKPTIPTNNNQLTNGAGFITSFTDTNTTYTGGTGITLTGTVFSNDITNNNQLTNGAGYITSFTDTNTTYTAGNGLTLTGTQFTMSGSYTGSFTATDDITAFSDERLKSNITTIEDALDKVKAMRGVMFDKTDSLTGELRQSTGVIAQETEKVLPEVVHNDNNTGYKSVAYGNIVGVLIEAIKEQQLQIDQLMEQVEFLKGKR
jgi:hypothetical protein